MIASVQSSQIASSANPVPPENGKGAEEGGTLDQLKDKLETSGTDSAEEFSVHEERELQKLQQRDRGVRQHELMHRIYAGEHARGHITFQYEVGPDGKRYAVHGEVSIDASPVAGNPEATIEKMRAIRRAATAPMDPSSADRRAAMMAQRMEAAARSDMREQEAEEARAEKRQEEFEEHQQPVEAGQRVVDPDQIVNAFRSSIRPELVSNLFDLFA